MDLYFAMSKSLNVPEPSQIETKVKIKEEVDEENGGVLDTDVKQNNFHIIPKHEIKIEYDSSENLSNTHYLESEPHTTCNAIIKEEREEKEDAGVLVANEKQNLGDIQHQDIKIEYNSSENVTPQSNSTNYSEIGSDTQVFHRQLTNIELNNKLDTKYKCNDTEITYSCDQCSYTTSSQINFYNHYSTHAKCINHKLYECKLCPNDIKSNALTQTITHNSSKSYSCDICGKIFFKKEILLKHIKSHTRDKPYSCNVCNRAFAFIRNLIRHKRIHTGDKPYSCNVCNKSFAISRNLLTHERTHTGDKPFRCDICNKTFSVSNTLLRHKRIHTGDKPYVCDVCNKTFSVGSDLITHKRIHTGEKPYSCNVCNKMFSDSSNFIKHKRTHTGDKPYRCDVCEKTFTISSTLMRHKRIHTGEKPYSCDMCQKAFYTNSNLITHKRTHTGDRPYVCDICNKTYSLHITLSRHKRKHTVDKK